MQAEIKRLKMDLDLSRQKDREYVRKHKRSQTNMHEVQEGVKKLEKVCIFRVDFFLLGKFLQIFVNNFAMQALRQLLKEQDEEAAETESRNRGRLEELELKVETAQVT